MKEFSNWINPYILLLKKYPERIFQFKTEEETALFEKVKSNFPILFLEFGSGSGNHIISQAALIKEAAFFGFEIRFKRAVRTIEKANKSNVENVFIIRQDAKTVCKNFKPASVNGIFVNFPDPWEKKRQRKNRLLQDAFLRTIYELLIPGGFFSFKSDHREYFLEVVEILKKQNLFKISEYTENLYQTDFVKNNIKTEFEDLFCSQNIDINYLRALK